MPMPMPISLLRGVWHEYERFVDRRLRLPNEDLLDEESGGLIQRIKTATSSTSTSCSNELDTVGVSVGYLTTGLIDEVLKAGYTRGSNIYDIEERVIRGKGATAMCPMDGRQGASYVHALGDQDPTKVGKAQFMLSYNWGYTIGQIVDTLSDYCQSNQLDPETTFVWICCLAVNQHRVVESRRQGQDVPFETFRDVFYSRVKDIGHVLAMMAPWQSPLYLTRAWCVFEIFTAATLKSQGVLVTIVTPPIEKENMVKAITEEGHTGVDKLHYAFANTKIENANASSPNDKQMILKLVREKHSYSALDLTVNKLLRAWVQETMTEHVNVIIEADETVVSTPGELLSNPHSSVISALNNIGDFFRENHEYKPALRCYEIAHCKAELLDSDWELKINILNNLAKVAVQVNAAAALTYAQKALSMSRDHYGDCHLLTARSLMSVGLALQGSDEICGALRNFDVGKRMYARIVGDNHREVADIYTHIGELYFAMGEVHVAKKCFLAALRIRNTVLGGNHPATAASYFDVGRTELSLGDSIAALEGFRSLRLTQERLLGRNHVTTALTYGQIGLAQACRFNCMYVDARRYLNEALEICQLLLGPSHPKTATVLQWLGRFLSLRQRDKDEASSVLRQALDAFKSRPSGQRLNIASCHLDIGNLSMKTQEYDIAIYHYTQFLEIKEALHPQATAEMEETRRKVNLARQRGHRGKIEFRTIAATATFLDVCATIWFSSWHSQQSNEGGVNPNVVVLTFVVAFLPLFFLVQTLYALVLLAWCCLRLAWALFARAKVYIQRTITSSVRRIRERTNSFGGTELAPVAIAVAS